MSKGWNEKNQAPDVIRIRGARVHNLRGINVDLPRDRMTVITGVSGSGKSSLAFDTIYAEGQRQYIESLSTYARQFLHQMQRPDVDMVEGLEPTLCIDQRAGLNNPRSTVGTVTEIYDYLRLLYARAGTPHCTQCGAEIHQQTADEIIQSLARLQEGTKLTLLSPMVRGRRGGHLETFAEISKAGLVRVRVDNQLYSIDEVPTLDSRRNHTIEAVIDRLVMRPGLIDRLSDSARLGLRLGQGTLLAMTQSPDHEQWDERFLSTRSACSRCDLSFEALEPRTFSFNSPYGACPACDGLGRREQFCRELIIGDLSLSPASGALAPWKGVAPTIRARLRQGIEPLLIRCGGDWDEPLRKLGTEGLRRLIDGDSKSPGLIRLLDEEWSRGPSSKRAELLQSFRGSLPCETCQGSRLRPESLAVTIGDLNIHQTCALAINQVLPRLQSLRFAAVAGEVAKPLLAEIERRLQFLLQVGVDYLSLDRPAETLSGGELQRVRLATSIGSGLVGVCYVLDEPSIGLHSRDSDRLIGAMRQLQQAGNTLIVVEHDESMIRAADWVVDLGPGAGQRGGQILAAGTPDEIAADERSVTGKYLSLTARVVSARDRRPPQDGRWLRMRGVTTNNLKAVDLEVPLGLFVGITGVSGSGKSSLINDTLQPALARQLGLGGTRPGSFESLEGFESIDKMIAIDQTPIGRSARSCPATFTGVFDLIRRVFAQTREAKQRGFSASRFSFNSAEGRCAQCQGHGEEKIEMNFLSDLHVLCTLCGGRRFNQQTLRVRYKHATIADVLGMTVDEAADFFSSFAKIDRFLQSMRSVGLGYLHLGQSSTTLSGGEAQRLKLATELARSETGGTLYLLDEPTTGLHFEDVSRLIHVLDSLVERGNTVIVIEHQLDVAAACDWIIDLGPEGGNEGGRILAVGTPEEIAASGASVTGPYLRPLLSRHSQ